MVKVRNLIVIGVVLAGLAAAGMSSATAQSSNEKPKATEVGVTASEIHIAAVADVDNPFAPGLFKGADRKSTRLNSSHPQHSFPTRRSSDLSRPKTPARRCKCSP